MSDRLRLIRPDDWHLHLRDGRQMAAVLGATARCFARAIVMPNLDPPVTTVRQAAAYRTRILEALGRSFEFEPLMTLYLTDNTTAEEIDAAADSDFVHACKLYPAGATTNSDSGVTNIEAVANVLERMAERGLPLLVHGEVTAADVDIFDRERVFIESVLEPLRQRLPQLRIVLEHVTSAAAVDYVLAQHDNVAATITPQHLMLTRNDLLAGGLRPHHYCSPVLKTRADRDALVLAATGGDARFFLGTDSAPHARGAKESACGCAGVYSAHAALELYAQVFESAGALDRLEGFASLHGADFYGLPHNRKYLRLERKPQTIPATYPFAGTELVPLGAGSTLNWSLVP